MSEQEFDDAKMTQDPSQTAEMEETDPQAGAAGYTPSRTEVNRGREQGLGVGQQDLDTQRDPTRANGTEQT